MATREERLQQRLRGPQRRQLDEYDDDFDFGIIVPPAPAAVSPIIPLAGQPAPISSSLPLRIPAQQTPIHPTQVSEASLPQSSGQRLSLQSANDANTSAKRRKLDTDPPLSTRSTRSSQRTARPDIYALSEQQKQKTPDAVSVVIEQARSSEVVEQSHLPDPRTGRTPPRTVEIVNESPADAPGSGRRLRTTISSVITATSQLQTVQQGSLDAEEESSPVSQRRGNRKAISRKEPSPDLSQEIRNDTIQATLTGDDDLDELSPEASDKLELDHQEETTPVPQRRGKRQVPPLRELSPDLSQEVRENNSSSNAAEDSDAEELSPGSVDNLDDEDEAVEIDDEQAAMLLETNQGQRSSKRFARTSPDPIHSNDVSAASPPAKRRKGRSRLEASPVQQRQPKLVNKKAKQPVPRKGKTKSARLGSPIPVTVFRLTKSVQHDEDTPDADILNYKIPRPQKGGPNVVDILAQVCREVVLSSLEGLENIQKRSTDPALKREFKTKCDAVESLGRELETRLLEHTSTLDHNASLRRRLQDEQKRKLNLREQISQVRAEREQIALRMDEIRIKHENETKKALSRNDVNSALHDIELAIDLGKTNTSRKAAENMTDMIGTELLLKRIASQVSNKSSSGGLLRQLKEANAFFERTALVLEGGRFDIL